MAYLYHPDLRSYVEALRRTGDLVDVKREVDWDLELGAIVRRVCEKKGPAPLFHRIKDYPGFRVLGAPVATWRRLAIVLGLDPESPIPAIVEEWRSRTSGPTFKPEIIHKREAPCKEKIIEGDDVDLFEIPAPMIHDGDGGRYIGTWHFVVAKDEETGFVNWGMYRQMIFDERLMVGPVLPFSDMGRIFYGKYEPRNKPMPFATVIGPDPLSAIASLAPTPLPEAEFASQLMGEPVRLVKCETSDLYVPATAEIVIEGEVIPNARLEEAPFGEYTGYRTSPRERRTVYRVTCVTMRREPILTVSNMGVPVDEGQLLRSFTLAMDMEQLLRGQGFPITGVYMWPESTHHLLVIGVKTAYPNIAQQVGSLVLGSKAAAWFHIVVVVDDGTDIYSLDEVIHAICTKWHPIRGTIVMPQGVGTPLNPFASPEERIMQKAPKVILDCTFPLEWPKAAVPTKVSFRDAYPREIQERVMSLWKEYGFRE